MRVSRHRGRLVRPTVRTTAPAWCAAAMAGAAAAAVLGAGKNAHAHHIWSAAERPQLRNVLTFTRVGLPTPALAAAIVVDGHVYYAIAGVRRADLPASGNNIAQADDMFPLGSISKPYTAAAMARAVDMGLVQWNDTI